MIASDVDVDALRFGLMLFNKVMFREFFWASDLTHPLSIKQRRMMADTSRKKMVCTARKVFKTGHVEAYVAQAVVTKTGEDLEEYMFHTPRQAHLSPVRDRIMAKFDANDFFRIWKETFNKSDGIFVFRNNCKWHFRIEGESGRGENMVGLRAKIILGDEGAFGAEEPHKQRQMAALPDCDWLWCGVPNGIRNSPFYKVDQTSEGDDWNHHRMTTYDNPIFDNPQARAELVKLYNGANTQGYITQVLGEWGAEASSAFPLVKVDRQRTFVFTEISGKDANANTQDYDLLVRNLMMNSHVIRFDQMVLGMDYGYAQDPSVILLAYHDPESDLWLEFARLKLYNVFYPYQARVLHAVNRAVGWKILKMCIDQQGNGSAVAHELVSSPAIRGQFDYSDIVIDAHTQGTWPVESTTDPGQIVNVPTKEFTRNLLRDALARGYEATGGYEGSQA